MVFLRLVVVLLVLLAAAAAPVLAKKEGKDNKDKGGDKAKGKVKYNVDGNLFVTVDDFALEVTGNQNVPKYTLFALEAADSSDSAEKTQKKSMKDDKAKSKVQFNAIYETAGADGSGKKFEGASLSSLDWAFSDPVELSDESGIKFIMTGTGKGYHIELHNYVGGQEGDCTTETPASQNGSTAQVVSAESDCPPPFSLKFDVVVKEYSWSTPEAQALVLEFSTDKGDNSNLALTVVEEAFWHDPANPSNKEEITVTIVDDDKKKSGLVYPRKSDGFTLVHDPTVSIEEQFPSWALWLVIGGGALLVAGLSVVACVVVVRRVKKNKVSDSGSWAS